MMTLHRKGVPRFILLTDDHGGGAFQSQNAHESAGTKLAFKAVALKNGVILSPSYVKGEIL